MSALDGVLRELDLWARLKRDASFWWRDDDAVAASPQLEQLLALAEREGVAVALAVIPAALEDSLPCRLQQSPLAGVLQHGIRHRSVAPLGVKKSEFPADHPRAVLVADLAAGRERLAAAFGEQFLPVLVPPWNRIDPTVITALPQAGLRGLSTMWARPQPYAVPGVLQINTHCDPVHWRRGRGFVGDYRACGMLLRHLVARRSGLRDIDEPTGLLTHHLDMDPATWDFCSRLFRATRSHPAVRWLNPEQVWADAVVREPLAC